MNNPESDRDEDMRSEYDLASMQVRKVGPLRARQADFGVILDDDVAAVFPDAKAVNEALRTLIRLGEHHRDSASAQP